MVDFREMLQKPVISAERPKPLPAGSYILQQQSFKYDVAGYKDKESGAEIPVVRFLYRVQQATEDVPPEMLEGVKDINKRILSKEFDLRDGEIWRLRAYLESAKCEGLESGRSFHECIESETNNKTYLADVTCTPSKKNPDEFFNNVGRIAGYHG